VPELVSVPTAAKRLNRDVRTVRKAIAQGQLQVQRVGDRDYVVWSELNAIVASVEVAETLPHGAGGNL
jgi:hypothetical protein